MDPRQKAYTGINIEKLLILGACVIHKRFSCVILRPVWFHIFLTMGKEMGARKEEGVCLFSQVTSNRTQSQIVPGEA